jgi:hypothetical protein
MGFMKIGGEDEEGQFRRSEALKVDLGNTRLEIRRGKCHH